MAKANEELSIKSVMKAGSASKVSPSAFLETYREFLCASEVGEKVKPIYEALDKKDGKFFPTHALSMIRVILFNYCKENDLLQTEAKRVLKEEKERLKEEIKAAKIAEAEAAGEDLPEDGKKEKKYIVSIVDERDEQVFVVKADNKGNTKEVPLCAAFDLYQDAERWAARRILLGGTDSFERTDPNNQMYGLNGWKGKIASPVQLDRNGEPIITVVNRNRAQEILHPKRANTVMKVKRPSGGLNISMCNVKGSDHCHFSHGLGSLISPLILMAIQSI